MIIRSWNVLSDHGGEDYQHWSRTGFGAGEGNRTLDIQLGKLPYISDFVH
jgi:hypothetical protein